MQKQNFIKIGYNEIELYRIFKDLERCGRAAFTYPNNPIKQRSIARSIGVRGKKVIDNGFLYPPAVTHNRTPSINVIALPVNIEIREKKGNKNSFFYFHRRSNIL